MGLCHADVNRTIQSVNSEILLKIFIIVYLWNICAKSFLANKETV